VHAAPVARARPRLRQLETRGCDFGLKVLVKHPEEFEQALREFRRKVQEQGLVREMRRRSHYVPPAEARKIKSLRARRRRTR
jgi:small subunit ribosomal protein S21